ncbi:hypothetical protein CYCD_05770 [Tenuifilaceae bacterium CYCD]|nr:hypothetical protein CYCD_05770 [Tenuifilaceae bacterium CYCD]
MKRKLFLSALLVVGLGLLIPFAGFGQTKKDAVDAYNSAATTYKQDPKAAIDNLLKAIEISDQLGEDATEIKVNSESLIPKAYFELAMALYKQKDLQGTLDNLEKAEETAIKYNDGSTKTRVEKAIPKLYNAMGTNMLKENKYEEAISNYIKALNFNPDYLEPNNNLVICYEKTGNETKMLEYIDKTIEVANKLNDQKTISDMKLKASNLFKQKAKDAGKDYKLIVENLTNVLKYDNADPDIYRSLTINYSNMEMWNEAITSALKAIELKTGLADEKAELYSLLATAYQKINDTAKACEAYKNAAYGTFKPNADYQIQQLKCQ